MADDLAGAPAATSASDDIAATVASHFPDASADSSSAPPAQEPESSPPPAIEGAAPGSTDAPTGPIPLDRHREILDNARRKAREDAEQEYRQKFGWAEQYQPESVSQMKQVWDWMQANPQQFIETFQKLVPPQAPAPEGPPGPDWRLEDGTLFYSAPQMQKLLEYQARQLRDQLDQEYGPIKQRVVEQEIGERAKREAGTLVGQARQHWPMFGDLEPDIKQAMAADHAISLHDAYIRVLRERGLKMQEDRIRSEYGAQLQRKADASTTPPRTPSSTPTSRTSLETRDLVTMEFDRLAKVR